LITAPVLLRSNCIQSPEISTEVHEARELQCALSILESTPVVLILFDFGVVSPAVFFFFVVVDLFF